MLFRKRDKRIKELEEELRLERGEYGIIVSELNKRISDLEEGVEGRDNLVNELEDKCKQYLKTIDKLKVDLGCHEEGNKQTITTLHRTIKSLNEKVTKYETYLIELAKKEELKKISDAFGN